MGIVYKAVNQINKKVYIGITSRSLKVRIREHNKIKKHSMTFAFSRAIQKYGKENFIWSVEFESGNYAELQQKEIELIKHYNGNSYNLTDGGQGTLGLKTPWTTERKLLYKAIKAIEGFNTPIIIESVLDSEDELERERDYILGVIFDSK